MQQRFYSEIMDPVHGYVYFTDAERSVIDTDTFQRLHRIKQLGMGFLVYPSATHSRFSHAIGAMHLAGLAADRMMQLGYLESDDWQALRFAALLHDLGHGPFSHSSEGVMRQKCGFTHEDMTTRLIMESEIGDRIAAAGYDKQLMSKLAVGKTQYRDLNFPKEIIAGQVDVDKMDFLNRDSYFTGVPYGKVDHRRLIEGLELSNDALSINSNALYALEQYIIARYEMFKAVYYHRTVRAAEIMYDAILRAYASELGFSSDMDVGEYLSLDDGSVWSKFVELSKAAKGSKEEQLAGELFGLLAKRDLLKSCYEVLRFENEPLGRLMENEKITSALVDSLANESGVDPMYIFLDSPTLPTVPLRSNPEGSELGVIDRRTDNLTTLSKASPLVDSLRKYMEVIRVYTLPKNRETVFQAAKKVFKRELLSEKVSY